MPICEEATLVKEEIDIHAVLGPYASNHDLEPLPSWPGDTRPELCGTQYPWFYTYAKAQKPRRILEIGVYKGYSAVMFVSAHPRLEELWLVDSGAYGVRLTTAALTIKRAWDAAAKDEGLTHGRTIVAIETNTGNVENLWGREEPGAGMGHLQEHFDLINVDGDHTEAGAYHDLQLTWPLLKTGGLLVMDDVDAPHEGAGLAGRKFAEDVQARVTHIPTFSGHFLFWK